MKPPRSLMPTGSGCWSIASSPIAATSGLPPGCAMPGCASKPASRTSITGPHANHGLPVPWVTRPAATTARFSISGFPSSSPSSRSPAVTAATHASCAASPESSSSSSTIGASNHSTPVPVVTFTRSSRNVTDAARPSSPARSRSTNGTPLSATRRPHDASFFERVVRRTCVLNSTICGFERLICQGIPLVIWRPDNRPF